MRIAIGSDHAGYELKEVVKDFLITTGYDVLDLGTNSTDSVDYPVYGKLVGEAVKDQEAEFGIVVCGSGIGISIAANKVPTIRCALVSDVYSAQLSRAHNNANVLALGGRLLGIDLAKAIVDKWLNTDFCGGRHQKRIDQL